MGVGGRWKKPRSYLQAEVWSLPLGSEAQTIWGKPTYPRYSSVTSLALGRVEPSRMWPQVWSPCCRRTLQLTPPLCRCPLVESCVYQDAPIWCSCPGPSALLATCVHPLRRGFLSAEPVSINPTAVGLYGRWKCRIVLSSLAHSCSC